MINSASPVRDASGAIVGSAVAIEDITALRRVQIEQETTAGFLLRLVNAHVATSNLVRAATEGLQERSGCQAVGID